MSLRLLAYPRAIPCLCPNLPLGATASSACPIVADRISIPRKGVVVPLDDWLPPRLVSAWKHPECEASGIQRQALGPRVLVSWFTNLDHTSLDLLPLDGFEPWLSNNVVQNPIQEEVDPCRYCQIALAAVIMGDLFERSVCC